MANNDPRTKRAKGSGPGWGGPAKGASASRITADAKGEAIRALAREAEHMAAKQEISAEMLAVQIDVARSSTNDGYRVIAADKVIDRLNGKSIARNVNVNVDDLSRLTDAELDARLRAELAAAGVGTAGGEAPAEDQGQPRSVVH